MSETMRSAIIEDLMEYGYSAEDIADELLHIELTMDYVESFY